MAHSSLTRRSLLAAGIGLGATTLGASAWALDRFVIDKAEVTNASSQGEVTPAPTSTSSGTLTATSYENDLYRLSISSHTSGSGSSALAWFVADIVTTDVTVLRSAFADDTFGENIVATPSEITDPLGAVWAVNGDYYGFRSTGITIRNGVAFRDKGARQGAVLTRDGDLLIYDETSTNAKTLLADGAWHTLSFGPALVNDGAVIDGIDEVEIDTNFGNHSVQGNQPRTGVGMIARNHFAAIVVDGRASGYSRGATMTEFAQIFADLGAQTAYNLDGGGSSVMLLNSTLVNNPLGKGKERDTSDVLYLGK